MKCGYEFWERKKAVLVTVIFPQYLVHDLLSPPESLSLCRHGVLGGVVALVSLRDVLLSLMVIVVVGVLLMVLLNRSLLG